MQKKKWKSKIQFASVARVVDPHVFHRSWLVQFSLNLLRRLKQCFLNPYLIATAIIMSSSSDHPQNFAISLPKVGTFLWFFR